MKILDLEDRPSSRLPDDESSSQSPAESTGDDERGRSFQYLRCFLQGLSSVLEIFPPPDRFDEWRISEDLDLDESRSETCDYETDLNADDSQKASP